MTREEAKVMAPIMKAFSEGKQQNVELKRGRLIKVGDIQQIGKKQNN